MKTGKISDLIPDPSNANKGTERGSYMLDASVRRLGVGRSIVADRNGIIVGGNKTYAAVGALGIDDIVIVETTGDRLVVVQRTDLDLSAPTHTDEYQRARELSIADNQSALVGISYDAPVIAEYIGEGIELDTWFLPAELEAILTPELNAMDGGGDGENRSPQEFQCTCPNCGHEFIKTI
jgi:hypothetical protein